MEWRFTTKHEWYSQYEGDIQQDMLGKTIVLGRPIDQWHDINPGDYVHLVGDTTGETIVYGVVDRVEERTHRDTFNTHSQVLAVKLG